MHKKKVVSSISPDKMKEEEPIEKKKSGSETEVKNANAAGIGAIGRNDQKISSEDGKVDQDKSGEAPPY